MRTCLMLGAGLLVLAAMSLISEAGIRVALDQVPDAAKKTVKERFPKAEIRFVDKEGGDRFEFALKEGKKLFDVAVSAAGKIVLIKEEIAAQEVPAAVKGGLEKKFPGAKIVEAEKLTEGDGQAATITYELVITPAQGANRDVVLDAAGKVIGPKE